MPVSHGTSLTVVHAIMTVRSRGATNNGYGAIARMSGIVVTHSIGDAHSLLVSLHAALLQITRVPLVVTLAFAACCTMLLLCRADRSQMHKIGDTTNSPFCTFSVCDQAVPRFVR